MASATKPGKDVATFAVSPMVTGPAARCAAMAKLSTGAKTIARDDGSSTDVATAIDNKRRIDTAYEIYLGLYQAITGPEERQKLFREFSPGFFDLIVIDECHHYRGVFGAHVALGGLHVTSLPEEAACHADTIFIGPMSPSARTSPGAASRSVRSARNRKCGLARRPVSARRTPSSKPLPSALPES